MNLQHKTYETISKITSKRQKNFKRKLKKNLTNIKNNYLSGMYLKRQYDEKIPEIVHAHVFTEGSRHLAFND